MLRPLHVFSLHRHKNLWFAQWWDGGNVLLECPLDCLDYWEPSNLHIAATIEEYLLFVLVLNPRCRCWSPVFLLFLQRAEVTNGGVACSAIFSPSSPSTALLTVLHSATAQCDPLKTEVNIAVPPDLPDVVSSVLGVVYDIMNQDDDDGKRWSLCRAADWDFLLNLFLFLSVAPLA